MIDFRIDVVHLMRDDELKISGHLMSDDKNEFLMMSFLHQKMVMIDDDENDDENGDDYDP